MKKCSKCQKEYNDNFAYCSLCGTKLQNDNATSVAYNNKNIIVAAIIVVIIAILGLGITMSEQKKMADTRQEMEDYRYETTPTTYDLKINSDWDYDIDGDYIYINGSVTNISSSKTISYYEVEARFYDSDGDLLGSDWTNDGDSLGPNETRNFEIMCDYYRGYDNIKLVVKEVE